ncbi:MAG: hypothetical protein FJ280_23200 [Planctomycetes bacterium]|nr:hypothetical protein [Planctomycetota bacterium]
MMAIIDGMRSMLTGHWFWGAVTLVCLTWYSTVTVYVAIKGAGDIRRMLRRLSEANEEGR